MSCVYSPYFASDIYDKNGRDPYESKDLPLWAWVVAKIVDPKENRRFDAYWVISIIVDTKGNRKFDALHHHYIAIV